MTTARTVEVAVTPEDIAAGAVGDCMKCPVARAVNRALGLDPDLLLIGANTGSISFECFGEKWWSPTPIRVADFIERFDRRLPVDPIAFRLEIPETTED